jgi:hypothetical protein
MIQDAMIKQLIKDVFDFPAAIESEDEFIQVFP